MAKTKTSPFDAADYLKTPAKRAAYLEAVIEECEGDLSWVVKALGNIARSEGMTRVAQKSKLSRENLYRALSGDKRPEFSTVLKVIAALGMQIHIVAR